MKNRYLVLMVALFASAHICVADPANGNGDGLWQSISSKVLLAADAVNTPVERILYEGFGPNGKVGGYHRVPKLLVTGFLAHRVYKNEMVRKVVGTVVAKMKCVTGCMNKKCSKKGAQNAELKKCVRDWEKEEAAA